jgi:hypothetical protein
VLTPLSSSFDDRRPARLYRAGHDMPREANLGLPMAQPGALARAVEFGVEFTTGVSTSADARCLPFSAEIHLAEANKTGFGSDERGVRAERNAGIDQLGSQRPRQAPDGLRD